MLAAASNCFKRFLQCNSTSISLMIEHEMCPNCFNLRFLREAAKGNRKPWDDYKHVNGYVLTSSPTLQRRRHHRNTNCITSIQIGISWVWPPSLTLNNSLGKYQSVATLASSTEDERTDEELIEILSTIEHSPNSAMEISTTYMVKLCGKGNLSLAVRLLQSLRDRRIFFRANVYNLLLEAATKGNDIGLVSQIFKDLLFSNEPISSISYLNLAKAFKGINEDKLLLGFIKEVSQLTFPRSATAINRIIYAFAECGQMDRALLIYDHMKSLKCKPDLITYNTVLGILGRVGRADEMLQEFASMKEANIIPDIVSYNTLLNSFRKLGRLDMCSLFLKEMKERGLEPDLRTYTALIDCFGRSGNIEESLRLFNEMKSRQMRISIYIYRSLINNLKKLKKLDLARMFLEEMNASLGNLVGPKDFRQKKR